MDCKFVCVSIFLINWMCFSCAHVSLNFPKARVLNLDSLNPESNKAPCGMPKGWIKTTLPSGMLMNFTWSMTYPHRGGYRIELWDLHNKWLANLTQLEPGQNFIKGNPTSQSHVVRIPDMYCQDCIVRLVREANEFGMSENGYFSCSDVDIVNRHFFENNCYGHGIPEGDSCLCYRGFSGPLCQYEEECTDDYDCNGRGMCIYIGGTNYPSRQCFCAPGFHGERCSLMNLAMLPTPQTLNPSMYKNKVLNDKVTIHYRMIATPVTSMNEIEFVMEIMGTSYGSLGMRPNSFDEKCKQWPAIDETMMGDMSMGNQSWISRLQVRSENLHNHTKLNIQSRAINGAMPMNINQRMTRASAYAPKMGMFHPMDCCDITVGAARGMFSRIRDYYTREIATPLLDEAYGGWDDITSATGWEMNGKTTLIFRKRLMAVDPADHSISGEMHVIWAIGQEPGKYVHVLPSGLEADGEMPTNKMFYTPDELKYHGHGMQRGKFVLDFAA